MVNISILNDIVTLLSKPSKPIGKKDTKIELFEEIIDVRAKVVQTRPGELEVTIRLPRQIDKNIVFTGVKWNGNYYSLSDPMTECDRRGIYKWKRVTQIPVQN